MALASAARSEPGGWPPAASISSRACIGHPRSYPATNVKCGRSPVSSNSRWMRSLPAISAKS